MTPVAVVSQRLNGPIRESLGSVTASVACVGSILSNFQTTDLSFEASFNESFKSVPTTTNWVVWPGFAVRGWTEVMVWAETGSDRDSNAKLASQDAKNRVRTSIRISLSE